MEAKSRKRQQRGKRDALAPLPESGDKFWGNAETEKIEIKPSPQCDHHFVYRTGREVECLNCHAGFVLDTGWHLKKGSIYYKNKKVL